MTHRRRESNPGRAAPLPLQQPLLESLDRPIELSAGTNRPADAAPWRAERATYPQLDSPPREKR